MAQKLELQKTLRRKLNIPLLPWHMSTTINDRNRFRLLGIHQGVGFRLFCMGALHFWATQTLSLAISLFAWREERARSETAPDLFGLDYGSSQTFVKPVTLHFSSLITKGECISDILGSFKEFHIFAWALSFLPCPSPLRPCVGTSPRCGALRGSSGRLSRGVGVAGREALLPGTRWWQCSGHRWAQGAPKIERKNALNGGFMVFVIEKWEMK